MERLEVGNGGFLAGWLVLDMVDVGKMDVTHLLCVMESHSSDLKV